MDANVPNGVSSARGGPEMDGEQFDFVARRVARQRPQRGEYKALGGGVLSRTMGSSTSAAKKKHNKESSDNSDSAAPNPGTQVGGIWDETIAICHGDAASGEVRVMEVSTPTVPQYLTAGDTRLMDCCVDTDCPKRLCLTSTGCIEGACSYDTATGE